MERERQQNSVTRLRRAVQTAIADPLPSAVDETVILLHPPLPLACASTAMERERQHNDSLVRGSLPSTARAEACMWCLASASRPPRAVSCLAVGESSVILLTPLLHPN